MFISAILSTLKSIFVLPPLRFELFAMVKKQLMNNYFLCLLGLVVFSCGNNLEIATYKVITANSIEERSAQIIELKGENFGPKREFGYLLDILLVNTTIVVQDQKKDYAFFGLKDGGDVIPFQGVGEGPDQVKDPNFIKAVSYDEPSNKIYFFNYPDKSLNSVEIQANSVCQEFGKVPELYWGGIQSAVNLNDSLIAVTGRFSETKFIVLNRNTQKEVSRPEYVNTFANELSEEGRVAVAPTDIKYNKKNNAIVLTNANLNSIDTYSADGESYKFYSFGEMKNLSPENTISRDYFYYYSVKTREDVVYGLYLGMGQGLIAMQDLFLSSTRPELHVFNLLTDELLRFKLDRLVNACVLDEENNIVYCIDENNEDQPLVKYKIPKI